jgi:hypothetical protein
MLNGLKYYSLIYVFLVVQHWGESGTIL